LAGSKPLHSSSHLHVPATTQDKQSSTANEIRQEAEVELYKWKLKLEIFVEKRKDSFGWAPGDTERRGFTDNGVPSSHSAGGVPLALSFNSLLLLVTDLAAGSSRPKIRART
jgi:hypothetical protein